jgi:hypothetical protein
MVSADVPATLESLVTEFLPATFAAAKATRGVGTYHGHCVVGDGERAWTLAVQDGELRVEPGPRSGAIGQLRLTSSDLPSLLAELHGALVKNKPVISVPPSATRRLRRQGPPAVASRCHSCT